MAKSASMWNGYNGVQKLYVFVGGFLALFGAGWSIWGAGPSGPASVKAVEGISIFAVLFVVAQAAERATEFVVVAASLFIPQAPEKAKQQAKVELRVIDARLRVAAAVPADAANAAAGLAEQKQEKEQTIEKSRDAHMVLGYGLSFALSALMVRELNYGLLAQVGLENVSIELDRLVTAAAAAGGSKGLHELIGRLQKAKETGDKAS